YGISTGLAVKIYKAYGDASLNVVRQQPYRLARDIHGIGFLTADKIARALGMKSDDPARIEAGGRHVLSTFTNDGHVFTRQPHPPARYLARQPAERRAAPRRGHGHAGGWRPAAGRSIDDAAR